ncbi:ECF-type sigma factor [Aquimonas sp.]|uniref:ECF-type sigma factor n=1 Tax=Aquimonas sp. TaxID=1872588 RepID=UPI0037C17D7E
MSNEITQLLKRHHAGERAAFDAMVPLVYTRLREIAHRQRLRGGERGNTLSTTALLQEAYLQLVEETGVDWQSRTHFFAICARAMRRILVDAARQRSCDKRGGGQPDLTLKTDLMAIDEQAEDILSVNLALDSLREFNERLAQVVECRYFGGLTEEETAAALGASLRTVQRDWLRARAWLMKAFNPA